MRADKLHTVLLGVCAVLLVLGLPAAAQADATGTNTVSKVFGAIDPGVMATVNVSDTTGVQRVAFAVTALEQNVQVRVTQPAAPPADAPNLSERPRLHVERSARIDVDGLNTSVVNASVTFSVPRDWMDAHGINTSTVRLYRLNGTWQQLDTGFVNDTAVGARFTADTPGFSAFAIAGTGDVKKEPEDDMPADEANGTASGPDQDGQDDLGRPGERPVPQHVRYLLAGLAVAVFGAVVYWRRSLQQGIRTLVTWPRRRRLEQRLDAAWDHFRNDLDRADIVYDPAHIRRRLDVADQHMQHGEYGMADETVTDVEHFLNL